MLCCDEEKQARMHRYEACESILYTPRSKSSCKSIRQLGHALHELSVTLLKFTQSCSLALNHLCGRF